MTVATRTAPTSSHNGSPGHGTNHPSRQRPGPGSSAGLHGGMAQTISIAVLAQDELTESLTRLGLRRLGPVSVIENGREAEADVVVVLTDELDETMLQRMCDVPGKDRGQSRPILLVCQSIDERRLLQAIDHGAHSVLDRQSTTLEALVRAILDVHHGRSAMPGKALRSLVRRVGVMRSPGSVHTQIDGRELAVIRLLADGLSTAEIAQKLSFSERTIKNVIAGVSARYDLTNRSHLVAFAFRSNLL